MKKAIDLRSDTVTRPGPGMRKAMADAEVGDDVYGEDPTVNRLQERVAELLATEAALFVPTGTMANQCAIKAHTAPGDEVLAGDKAHSFLFESGAASALSGVQVTTLPGDGRFTAVDVRKHFKPDNHHHPSTRLVMVENTHNIGGGLLWDAAEVTRVQATARELGLALHLDGARLWNAAAASGKSEKEIASGYDSISVCLSKGLGAPVGSLVAGSKAFVHKAHRARKMFGGGMRQAGILAAAGLYALDNHRKRLVEDHENARLLARSLGELKNFTVDEANVHSNIVLVDVVPGGIDAIALEKRARELGLLFNALGPTRLRLVTHLDVDRAACEEAISRFRDLFS